MQIAKRVYSLAQEQNDSTLMIGACIALWQLRSTIWAISRPRDNTRCVVFRSGARAAYSLRSKRSTRQPSVVCAMRRYSEWHFGEIASCHATMAEAISLAKELNDMHGLAVALCYAACLAHFERNPAEVERLASDLIELSTRQNFAHWLAVGEIFRGWARSASGDTAKASHGSRREYENYRATGSMLVRAIFSSTKG